MGWIRYGKQRARERVNRKVKRDGSELKRKRGRERVKERERERERERGG